MDKRTKIRTWYSGISRRGRLRTKFLLSLLLVSASLTCATLLIVRHRVRLQVRDEIREALQNSVVTFQNFQRQREIALEHSASLLALQPLLAALMTTQDQATIQDSAADWWRKMGSGVFVLADRSGRLMALHTDPPSLTSAEAQESLLRSLRSGQPHVWWFGSGHLFEIFIQPIYFG